MEIKKDVMIQCSRGILCTEEEKNAMVLLASKGMFDIIDIEFCEGDEEHIDMYHVSFVQRISSNTITRVYQY